MVDVRTAPLPLLRAIDRILSQDLPWYIRDAVRETDTSWLVDLCEHTNPDMCLYIRLTPSQLAVFPYMFATCVFIRVLLVLSQFSTQNSTDQQHSLLKIQQLFNAIPATFTVTLRTQSSKSFEQICIIRQSHTFQRTNMCDPRPHFRRMSTMSRRSVRK